MCVHMSLAESSSCNRDPHSQKYLLSDPLREKFTYPSFILAPRVGGGRTVISLSHLPGCPK